VAGARRFRVDGRFSFLTMQAARLRRVVPSRADSRYPDVMMVERNSEPSGPAAPPARGHI
jgi:hypothetical protein